MGWEGVSGHFGPAGREGGGVRIGEWWSGNNRVGKVTMTQLALAPVPGGPLLPAQTSVPAEPNRGAC